jgi:threonine dehydratase
MSSISLRFSDIEAARHRIRDAVYLSPCAHSRVLSAMTDTQLYLKLENLQMTGSFKERGACNKLELLSADERARGVITASAGNHAQGVAYHARRLKIAATIVMPLGTPLVKASSTREMGAEVILHGANFDEAYARAREIEKERGLAFVHPFDDFDIMAGQGTIGLELLEQNPYLEAVLVPIGGGGIAAGTAVALKETNPRIKIYGVEAAAVPSMSTARTNGGPIEVDSRRTIADGIAVRRVGDRPFEICQKYLDDVIAVDEETIAEAVLLLLEREKTVAEGAGATAMAGVLSGNLPIAGKRIAVVVSGGNIDVNLISRVIDRGLWRTGRLARLRCVINDVPGALSGLLAVVARFQANVLEIEHERVGAHLELGQTIVEILVETRGISHLEEMVAGLEAAGITTERTESLSGGTVRRSARVP